MSLLNGFNGQGSRPPARPTADQPQAAGQPTWGQPQAAHPAQPHHTQPGQQWAQPSPAGYSPQTYGHPPAPTQGHAAQNSAAHGYPAQHAPSYGSLSANPDPYAPSFEPYSAPAAQPSRAPQAYQPHVPAAQTSTAHGYGQQAYGAPEPRTQSPQHQSHQPAAHQWAPAQPQARGYDAGSYLQQPVTAQTAPQYRAAEARHHEEPSLSDWQQQGQPGHHGGQDHANAGYDYADPNGYEPGFAQPAGGELEQQYADEDGQDYEIEEPGRARRPMMIAVALVGAILVGGGMAYGYKSMFGGGAERSTAGRQERYRTVENQTGRCRRHAVRAFRQQDHGPSRRRRSGRRCSARRRGSR